MQWVETSINKAEFAGYIFSTNYFFSNALTCMDNYIGQYFIFTGVVSLLKYGLNVRCKQIWPKRYRPSIVKEDLSDFFYQIPFNIWITEVITGQTDWTKIVKIPKHFVKRSKTCKPYVSKQNRLTYTADSLLCYQYVILFSNYLVFLLCAY